ncbi:aspartic peptidase A1 [Peniophora sp. CONT]|nr:aspartic peptidase A1 [Peniophora sp. CONT]
MSPATRLVSLVFFALAACASPIVTIHDNGISVPLTKRVNITSGHAVLASDRARAEHLRTSRLSNASPQARASAPVTNEAVIYTAAVDVGSPPTTFNLIVDTGSSNTWVGAVTRFTPTSTTTSTGSLVEVTYGSGFVLGEEFIDTVSLGEGLTVPKQSIGAAIISEGFSPDDGIIGIGPVDLTEGTTDADTVPTITDNLFTQGTISTEVIGISFQPATSDSATNGELTFGGTDSSKFTGDITFTPITSTSPASEFWGIDQTVAYGDDTILPTTAGIVDTGTTLLLLATDAFDAYTAATGATPDSTTGLLSVTPEQFAALKSLFFTIGGTTFEFTPNAQLWPRSLNADIGGDPDGIFLIVGDLGTDSGEGLDFINGFAFLERFYSVFDTTNSRVGFATTPFTNATTN